MLGRKNEILESVKKYRKGNLSDAYRVKRPVWSGGAQGEDESRFPTRELLSAAARATVGATIIILRRSA